VAHVADPRNTAVWTSRGVAHAATLTVSGWNLLCAAPDFHYPLIRWTKLGDWREHPVTCIACIGAMARGG
jgi:hypothetical protein